MFYLVNSTFKISLNQTNNGLNDYKYHLIIIPISILVDIFSIFIIRKTHKNLIKVEYYLLLGLMAISILVKISLLNSIVFLTNVLKVKKNFCVFVYSMDGSSVHYNLTLIYYSLYHLSSLDRSKYLLRLNNHIKKPKIFVIYFAGTLTVSYVYWSSVSIGFQNEIFVLKNERCQIKDKWHNAENLNFLWSLLFQIFSNIVTLLSYYLSFYLLIKRIFIKKIKYSINQLKYYKKFFKVILKFFLFNILSSLNGLTFILICIQAGLKSKFLPILIQYLIILAQMVACVQTTILLVIHQKLKREIANLFQIFTANLKQILKK